MKYVFLINKNKKGNEIYKKNLEIISSLEKVEAIKNTQTNCIIDKLREYNLVYNFKYNYHNYEDLAYFLSKYGCIKEQVNKSIDYLCIIEDNISLMKEFFHFTNSLVYLFVDPELNLIRLGKSGEGYIISLDGAKRIINIIENDGIVNQINDQLSKNCGKELNLSSLTPWIITYDEEEFTPIQTFNNNFMHHFSKNHKKLLECERINQFIDGSKFGEIEGHMGNSNVKKNIIRELIKIYNIKKILQIGLNAGNSAELLLTASNDTTVLSFDIGHHHYIDLCNYYIYNKYGNRHTLIKGDSKMTVRDFSNYNNDKYDLILIDGDHSGESVQKDIENCRLLSHEKTIIMLNDVISNNDKLQTNWTIEPTKIWKEYCYNKKINEMGYFDIGSGVGFVYGQYI